MKSVIIARAVIGLACAWRLAQCGWNVNVFDPREAVGESSWAAAGMLAPGREIDLNSALAKMAVRSLCMFPVFVPDLEEESGNTVEFRQSRAIEVAMDETEAEVLTQRAARQASIDIVSEPCLYNDFVARSYPADCIVDPLSINDALLTICRQRGVVIREQESVAEVLGNGIGERTTQGAYHADRAWSSTLFPGLPQVYPVRGRLSPSIWNWIPEDDSPQWTYVPFSTRVRYVDRGQFRGRRRIWPHRWRRRYQ